MPPHTRVPVQAVDQARAINDARIVRGPLTRVTPALMEKILDVGELVEEERDR